MSWGRKQARRIRDLTMIRQISRLSLGTGNITPSERVQSYDPLRIVYKLHALYQTEEQKKTR